MHLRAFLRCRASGPTVNNASQIADNYAVGGAAAGQSIAHFQ